MSIILKPEQEQVLLNAIQSGLAQTPDEALDQALDTLRARLSGTAGEAAAVVRRLASFGARHGLSLGTSSVKDLLRESRP